MDDKEYVLNYIEDLEDRIEYLEKENELLKDKAYADPSTGAFNRRKFRKDIKEEISRSERNRDSFAVLVADINNLKLVNDAYGHDRGDEVIDEVLKAMDCSIRDYDFVYRWGGDEFTLLMPETSYDEMVSAVDRIYGNVCDLKIWEELDMEDKGGISIGATGFEHEHYKRIGSDKSMKADALFKLVDIGLYSAKNSEEDLAVVKSLEGFGDAFSRYKEDGSEVDLESYYDIQDIS